MMELKINKSIDLFTNKSAENNCARAMMELKINKSIDLFTNKSAENKYL
jgi:hypothetical protein